jgi:hypothetical protein
LWVYDCICYDVYMWMCVCVCVCVCVCESRETWRQTYVIWRNIRTVIIVLNFYKEINNKYNHVGNTGCGLKITNIVITEMLFPCGHHRSLIYETSVEEAEDLIARILAAREAIENTPKIFKIVRRNTARRFDVLVWINWN